MVDFDNVETLALLAMGFYILVSDSRARVRSARDRKELKAAKAKAEAERPLCGCKHHYSMHDADGVCGHSRSERVLVERGTPRTVGTGYYGDKHVVVYDHERWEVKTFKCSCRRYTGPEPLPTYIP